MISTELLNKFGAILPSTLVYQHPLAKEAIKCEIAVEEFWARCRAVGRYDEPKVKNVKNEAKELAASHPDLTYEICLLYLIERLQRAIMANEKDLSYINGDDLVRRINARKMLLISGFLAVKYSLDDEGISV